MQILDKGEIKLIDSMASDLSVVKSARVSNGIITETEDQERDQKLINYLMKHRHGTPFEHSVFTFYIKCPIFVAREWHRHRIGSFNEISGRYVEFKPEFYTPSKFRVQSKSNKQGGVFPEEAWFRENKAPGDWYSSDVADIWDERNRIEITNAFMGQYNTYRTLLQWGVAKEMARIVLPLATYTEFYWTVNARSLMNFLSLRMAEDAQWEIRQYANELASHLEIQMPMTYNAWILNNKLAP